MAEKGDQPCIVIYEYPSLRAYRILRGGTEMAYANLDFSPNGEKLASVGSAPDYMLTVWDWNNENIELRSKAFSQDVYKVAFSPENEGHLCTSGTGHIRFNLHLILPCLLLILSLFIFSHKCLNLYYLELDSCINISICYCATSPARSPFQKSMTRLSVKLNTFVVHLFPSFSTSK